MHLEGEVIFPDIEEFVFSQATKLVSPRVCLRAGGRVPRLASASNQPGVGRQPPVVQHGLEFGDTGRRGRSGGQI